MTSETHFDDPDCWAVVAQALARQQCVVFPTDTVYGIAARADSLAAVERLQRAKGRTDAFPPPVLVADAGQAWTLVSAVPLAARNLGTAFWPGALTLILPTTRSDLGLSASVGTVGVRVPDHDDLRALLRRTGPLAVSSANKHNRPPATTVGEARDQLGDAVAVYIDGGPTPGPAPSTVVDCTGAELVIVRLGLLTPEQIQAAAGVSDA